MVLLDVMVHAFFMWMGYTLRLVDDILLIYVVDMCSHLIGYK
jgi:hypothetical protein